MFKKCSEFSIDNTLNKKRTKILWYPFVTIKNLVVKAVEVELCDARDGQKKKSNLGNIKNENDQISLKMHLAEN